MGVAAGPNSDHIIIYDFIPPTPVSPYESFFLLFYQMNPSKVQLTACQTGKAQGHHTISLDKWI